MQDDVRKFFNDRAEHWDIKEVRDEKWLRNFLFNHVPIAKGMNILDVGCGTGIVSNILFDMSQTKVVALDVSERMINIAKQKHKDLDIDFYSENFYHTTRIGFDMIVCFNAYPHFTDVVQFKKQVIRCLNESGFLVILHNLSREQLDKCHEGLSEKISRSLQEINLEVELYKDNFDNIELIDNDDMFMMLLQKRKGEEQ